VTCAGRCYCQHYTAGDHCDRCISGYYGTPTDGTPDDCQPCPCPSNSNCVQLLDRQVACVDCPAGHTGQLSLVFNFEHLLTVSIDVFKHIPFRHWSHGSSGVSSNLFWRGEILSLTARGTKPKLEARRAESRKWGSCGWVASPSPPARISGGAL